MYKKVGALLLFFFLAFMLFAQDGDWYVGKPIRRLEFTGLKSVKESELDGIFDSYKGKHFTDDIYLEILQKIYGLDYFSDVVPKALPADDTYSSVNLVFDVVEKPSIAGYKFIGNNRVRSSELLKKAVLKKGDIYNENKAKQDEQAIKDYYSSKGYDACTLSFNVISNEDENTVVIEYSIKEGRQTVISSILFEGNNLMPDKKLKKVMASKEARLLGQGPFIESNLEQDKIAINELYASKGYMTAHVETIKKEVDADSDPEKNILILTYVIMEGEQYTYGGTTFEGNKIFKTAELEALIKLNVGEVMNMAKYKKAFDDIVDVYYENGYMSAYINLKHSIDPATKIVAFIISISEDERSHVENIIIRGNKRTKDYVILREILLKPGDVFSKGKFFNSLRNLYNLRYFSSIVPDYQQGSEKNLVDLIINVEEQNTADIGFGITFSGVSDANTFPMSVYVEWNEKNLMGRGSALNAHFNAGPNEQRLKLGYTENWFLGTPLSVGFNVSTTHKKLSAFQDVLPPFGVIDPFVNNSNLDISVANAHSMKYHRWELGFGINTAYRWFPRYSVITLSGGVDFNLVKNVYDKSIFRPYDPVIRAQQRRWSLSNSLWTKVAFDDRDLAYDPSKGWFLSQQFSFFGIIPKVENEYFFRSDTKGELYFTLLDYPVSDIWNLKFVLGFYSGFSFQAPLNKKPIGVMNQLFIDGMFLGRGWYTLGPEGFGNVMLNHWVEFRMPLAPGILSLDFFFDAIAVKHELKDLKTLSINDYYFSFGPGLRFSLPQFPLRLMFANTFRSKNGKPYWAEGKADWKFVISFNIPNL